MTDMRRITIALPDKIDKEILELRKDNRFIRSSYAEIIRYVLELGLEKETGEKGTSIQNTT